MGPMAPPNSSKQGSNPQYLPITASQVDSIVFSLITLARLLLHQQEEHVLHIVLDSAGLVSRDGAKAQPGRATATAADMTSEEVEGADAAATWLVLLQDLRHLHRDTPLSQQRFCQAEALVMSMSQSKYNVQMFGGIKLSELIVVCICM